MDYNTRPFFYGTGRRKSSVARVRLYQGTGKVTINGRDIDDYFGLELASQRIVKHWHARCQNWDMVLNQLEIMFADRKAG